MLKWVLFSLLSLNLFALEVTLQGAKEDFVNYSILHIKDHNSFLCEEITDDFDEVTKIVCAFSKQPATKFEDIQNSFFKITTQKKRNTFFLIITPYQKIKLYPMIFALHKDDSIFSADIKLSKHWMILGYKDKQPYINQERDSDISINFPFFLDRNKLPFVGGLDIKGNPVQIKRVKDVKEYIKIKKLYTEKKYESCLDLVNEVMHEYPNTLFMSELLFYKIRTNSKLENYEVVIDLAKVYLREFSSDEHVPEILALIARSYAKLGIGTDAEYYFNRLFTEHRGTPESLWGYIYKGEMLESSGSPNLAVPFYNKALHDTDDIDIAVTAAYALANYKITYAEKKDATVDIMKIINAKPIFLMNDLFKSLSIMHTFVNIEEYETAAAMAKAIADETDVKHEDHEELRKNVGMWLSYTDKKQQALDALNEYIKVYKYGTYIDEVEIAKDSLFFDSVEKNVSEKIKNYDKLIETYQESKIGNRALYEKAKLLRDNSMYIDVLDIEDSVLELNAEIYKDTKEIILDSAIGFTKQAIQKKQCKTVLDLFANYEIVLSYEWDDGVYECSMKGSNFELAKKVASKNLNLDDLQERKKWLYNYIKIDFAVGNYSDVIKASKELITLIDEPKKSKYKDIYRILFDAYQRTGKIDKRIEVIADLEKIYGLTYIDIERYVDIMTIGSQRSDDNMIIKYATKVMKIQNSSSSYAQSPFVEFALYQAYINKQAFNEALETIKSLDNVELSKNKRSRQKYLLGSIYEKLWREDEAKQAYQQSIDADATSAWAKLAESAKDI